LRGEKAAGPSDRGGGQAVRAGQDKRPRIGGREWVLSWQFRAMRIADGLPYG